MFLKIFIYYYIGPKTTFSETVNPVLPVSAIFKTNSCRCGPLCLVSVHHNASSILHRYSLLLKEKQLTVGVCSRCATVRSGANASAKADHQPKVSRERSECKIFKLHANLNKCNS